MRKPSLVATALLSLLFVFARSPEERTITDPATITSEKNAAARPVGIEDLFYSRTITDPAWSPDGKSIVFATNLTGRLNVWKVPSTGGWPLQIGVSDDRQFGTSWSPDGKWILWQQDRGGNEAYDLYAVPARGGSAVNLTGTPEIAEADAIFSPDSKSLAISYKPAAASMTDVAVIDLATKSVRNLTNEKTAGLSWAPVAWSSDGKWLVANRTNTDGTVGEIFTIDFATGRITDVTQDAKASTLATDLSPDDKTILAVSNRKNGYDNVALIDVATKSLKWVTDVKWEATANDFSPDGKWITYSVNEDGRSDAYLAPVAGGAAIHVDLAPGLNTFIGRPSTFSPDGRRLLLRHQSSTETNDFWVYDVAAKKATKLTESAIASLTTSPLPAAQIVHYKSFDNTIISAFLWMPFNLERNGKNPAIVLPHGGPTGQTLDSFNRNVIALVSRGYAVIAPNVRGSTGYGMAFQKMNYQDLGGGDLQDEVYAAKFLAATGYIDPKKVGMTGGSYGGFMTLMAIGRTPDTWAAAVALYGIIDWMTMLQHTDPRLQEYIRSLLGDPVKDPAVYAASSPIKYLGAAKTPLLVLQGENDIRVPKEEAEQVVARLKQDGKTVDAHFYPAEGHGFAKRENQIDAIKRMIDWFDRYLK